MSNPIFLPVWMEVLVQLHKAPDSRRYCQRICREVDTSMNHLRAIVKRLAEKRLIEITFTKKINRIVITDKGKRMATAFQQIKSELE